MNKSLLYLNTPSTSKINPPVDITMQTLPVEQLGWEDFEKLCLRLAQLEHSIDNCEIYDIKGQKQQGIDIFAQKENGKYSSYQCKRYQEVTEDVLEKAVNKFVNEQWKPKSDKFYFCTTAELNLVQWQDKFNQLKTDLQAEGIQLIKWDKIQIESLLKDQPQIVFDFFGREWTRLFNGEEKLNAVVTKRKLDSNQVIKCILWRC
jgi:predicted helicase